MKSIFIDANIFLHFLKLDQIDWPAIAESESFQIIVCSVTLDELDKLKGSHPLPRMRDRAGDSAIRIEQWTESGEVKPGIPISFVESVYHDECVLLGFDPTNSDHVLIATVLAFDAPKESKILLTNDSGPRMKCKMYGIKAMTLPNEYRLPQETSEEQKLRKELL